MSNQRDDCSIYKFHVNISMVMIKLLTIFKYSIVYIKHTYLMNIDVIDLNSS